MDREHAQETLKGILEELEDAYENNELSEWICNQLGVDPFYYKNRDGEYIYAGCEIDITIGGPYVGVDTTSRKNEIVYAETGESPEKVYLGEELAQEIDEVVEEMFDY